jgi:uncharacterized protein (TIGR00290 family)
VNPGTQPVVLSWSGGKDSGLALHEARRLGWNVIGLLTTVTEGYDRISMHGVRRQLLHLQAVAAGLPAIEVSIPPACPNAVYQKRMGEVVGRLIREGVRAFAFGDLFLEDVRAYRELQLASTGAAALFPLWGRDTAQVGREFVDLGFRAVVCAVDPRKLDPSFAGRDYDLAFLADLPPGVDPCGERGEFHSFVWDGPIFAQPIPVRCGPVVERDGFVFADLLPAAGAVGRAGTAPDRAG